MCTWNINGVNEPVKVGKVLSQLKALQADVIFYQDTSLKNVAHNKLGCTWISQIFPEGKGGSYPSRRELLLSINLQYRVKIKKGLRFNPRHINYTSNYQQ